MERSEIEANVRAVFDTVAAGYDHPGSYWFDQTAQAIATAAGLGDGDEALDVATGTGKVALALAGSASGARVVGADLSEGMLGEARRKADAVGLRNTEFVQSSFEGLAFGERFDVVTCSFGIFFVPEMVDTLKRFAAQAKSGGRVILSTFAVGSFSPLSDAFVRLYEEFGFEVGPRPWLRVGSPELLGGLYDEAGLPGAEVVEHDFGFELRDENVWWDIVFNAGYRGMLEQLSEEQAPRFKERHLSEVRDLLAQDGGSRLDVRVLIGQAAKTGSGQSLSS
ncbi:MAG: class I SAM-dependent methyltransferase [Nannocystales bacterium]